MQQGVQVIFIKQQRLKENLSALLVRKNPKLNKNIERRVAQYS